MPKFEGIYQVEDGYAGGARPQYFTIDDSDIEDDMSESDLEELFEEFAQDDFEDKISFCTQNGYEFVEWAKKVIKDRAKEWEE